MTHATICETDIEKTGFKLGHKIVPALRYLAVQVPSVPRYFPVHWRAKYYRACLASLSWGQYRSTDMLITSRGFLISDVPSVPPVSAPLHRNGD